MGGAAVQLTASLPIQLTTDAAIPWVGGDPLPYTSLWVAAVPIQLTGRRGRKGTEMAAALAPVSSMLELPEAGPQEEEAASLKGMCGNSNM